MKKKTNAYLLVPTSLVVTEGEVSFYKILRDGDFSEELLEKYSTDVKDLLYSKLDQLALEKKVLHEEISRIKELIEELVNVTEIMQKNCDCAPKKKN